MASKRGARTVEEIAPGRRMSYWIAQAIRTERERARVEPGEMALALGVSETTIKRLEQGENYGRDIDKMIAGYAYVLGLDDSREFWGRALEEWYHHGAPTSFIQEGSRAQEFARLIRETAQRQRPYPDVRSEMRTAIPKKRASG